MKILYHHRIRSKDGQYVHVSELTGALAKLGHELLMVGPPAVEEGSLGAGAGLVAALKRWLPRSLYELLELAYSLVAYRRLARAIRRHRPDCMYERYNLFLPAGIWAKRRFGLPLLLEVNAPLYEERKKFGGIGLDRLARWSERYAWRGADFVLPVTRVLAGHVAGAGVDPERIRVVPNGIDADRFANAPGIEDAKRRLGLEGRLVLGFTGFVREWHGIERVVELIAADSDARRHLLIVGDGPARRSIEETCRRHGVADRVTITGVVGRDAVAAHVAAFDIAIQPAVVPYASPLKLFEYLALGRAIVAPSTENIREVLEHEKNAILFDPADPEAFPRAVDRLASDDALREAIGAGAARTIAEKGLTWTENARRVEELFRELLERDRDRAGIGRSALASDTQS